MENETVIQIENIGKKYNIAHQQGGYVALRDVLTNVLKSPFAFIKQKTKEVAGIAKKEEFWALRNVNFEVKKGEVIGVIGSNGAGKSTLLKILSQITPPTEGEIKISGRVGSLLEVGTGFHPELSGRENIFLNGAILGMTKKEIAKKFDDIVAFSGIEKFLDTPVKRYSSGMYVRLAFSVAAHMDPDILIIDEVLAVGDAEFQKKCLGKMDDITKKEGRTIIFVSHNLNAISALCRKAILLEKGKISYIGDTSEVIRKYLGSNHDTSKEKMFDVTDNNLSLVKIKIAQEDQESFFISTKKIIVEITVQASEIATENFACGFNLFNGEDQNVLSTYFNDIGDFNKFKQLTGLYNLRCEVPENFLNEGNYRFVFDVGIANVEKMTDDNLHYLNVTIKNIDGVGSKFGQGRKWRNSAVLPYFNWELKNND